MWTSGHEIGHLAGHDTRYLGMILHGYLGMRRHLSMRLDITSGHETEHLGMRLVGMDASGHLRLKVHGVEYEHEK